ncbi:tryptophan-rich sensory protein [Actinomadura sp. NAK00032]|uniref:TspO/MBR family protein n=1 Tax=Actinomadura sp. NAK00032 TaxID=2742128 RepID=UPI001590C0FC|nr:TspO/MBR family protein [Actinomadura sp. NAK00032]QKW36966.1 tryptophan-rich sensory protein [Actinomadura sp. NAK00032]
MEPTRKPERGPTAGGWPTYAATAAAVTVTATIGSKAVKANSVWYQSLSKPPWQPPPWTFGLVWTPLYASIAWAGGRALLRARGRRRRALATSLGVNLMLNAAWNQLFFALRSTKAGLVGTALLDISNADLIRRTTAIDTASASALVPYAAWCTFATALNADIAYRNS